MFNERLVCPLSQILLLWFPTYFFSSSGCPFSLSLSLFLSGDYFFKITFTSTYYDHTIMTFPP